MRKRWNSHHELSQYFGTEERPVSQEEFIEFWDSLSAADQMYFMAAPLSGIETRFGLLTEHMGFKPVTEIFEFWTSLHADKKNEIAHRDQI